MLVQVTGTDSRDIRTNLLKHRTVVGEGTSGLQEHPSGLEPVWIGIRNRHHLRFGQPLPHLVQTMSVVAPPGVADDSHPKRRQTLSGRETGPNTGRSGSEEETAVHERNLNKAPPGSVCRPRR
jgi:hypothetical protein